MSPIEIKQGDVFYGPNRQLTSPLPHYLIVLNRSPNDDECVVLEVITSQVEKVRKRVRLQGHPASTIVYIQPSEYPPLTKPSVVNCNDVLHKVSLELFLEDIKGCSRKPGLPQELFDRIIAGILESPAVSDEVKSMLK